jgi:hypothetical protein
VVVCIGHDIYRNILKVRQREGRVMIIGTYLPLEKTAFLGILGVGGPQGSWAISRGETKFQNTVRLERLLQ